MNLWCIPEKPKKIVGSKNNDQTITPQTGLNPPARVNINRKIALAIARVLKDIEYRAIEYKSANKPNRKTKIFKALSRLPGGELSNRYSTLY